MQSTSCISGVMLSCTSKEYVSLVPLYIMLHSWYSHWQLFIVFIQCNAAFIKESHSYSRAGKHIERTSYILCRLPCRGIYLSQDWIVHIVGQLSSPEQRWEDVQCLYVLPSGTTALKRTYYSKGLIFILPKLPDSIIQDNANSISVQTYFQHTKSRIYQSELHCLTR